MKVVMLKNKTTPRDAYEDLFTECGHDAHFVPLLNHDPVSIEDTVCYLTSDAFLKETPRFIITSQRAVIVFHECLDRISAQDPSTANIIRSKIGYTVGPATEKVLRDKGFTDVRGGAEAGNGAALADIILLECSGADFPIVFFTGMIRKDIIPVKLRNNGFSVNEVVIYKTAPKPDILDNFKILCHHHVDWIVFFSPQGTDDIVHHITTEKPHSLAYTKFASIGPTTQDFLVSRGIHPHVVASKPTAHSLLDSLAGISK